MNISNSICLQRSLLLCLFLLSATLVLAGDPTGCPGDTEPLTTHDPQIPLDEFEIRLKPLTRCELAEEAKGWMGLLKTKAQEISNKELVAKHKKREHKQAEEALKALEDAKEALDDLPDANQVESPEATLADQKKAEAALAEAQEQIDEAIQEQDKSADVGKTDVATKALKKIDTEQLQDQGKMQQVSDAAAQLADSKAESRQALLEHINQLHAERTTLIDRANLVIESFEGKGGAEEQIEEYRQYIKAISGIKVDVADVDATTTAIKGWLLSKEGGLRWGKNIAIFIVTLLAFYFISIIVGRAAERTLNASKHTSALLSDFLAKAIRRGIIMLGILAGLAALEVNVGPLLAVIGALGFVVAFALQNSLGNFASGILILLYRPFDVGDLIEVSGILGRVSSMNLLSTHIKTLDNKSVIVPNNSIWGDVITNATGTNKRRVDMLFGIGYQDDINKAQKIMEDILSSHELVLTNPEPVVRLHELGDSSVNFICRPWTKTENYWNVYWDVTKAVKEQFDAEEISIPFPQQDVHLFTDQPVNISSLPDKSSS